MVDSLLLVNHKAAYLLLEDLNKDERFNCQVMNKPALFHHRE
jgi:hypothetical protein